MKIKINNNEQLYTFIISRRKYVYMHAPKQSITIQQQMNERIQERERVGGKKQRYPITTIYYYIYDYTYKTFIYIHG